MINWEYLILPALALLMFFYYALNCWACEKMAWLEGILAEVGKKFEGMEG